MNAATQPWPVNAEDLSLPATSPPLPSPPLPSPRVYAAIAKVMADIGKAGIRKARVNEQQRYQFRGIDDVYNALSAFLSTAGLCILPRVTKREVTERATKNGGVLFYVVLDVEFDLVCAEDGSRHTVTVVGEAMDSGDKATNKAMSAAYKYACMQTFCIPTEGNPDADAETHEPAPKEIPDDCWIFLQDAAAEGEPALRAAWKELQADTRDTITRAHSERWERIKASAKAAK